MISKNKSPLISIIIPTYNHAEFLKDSLGSVISQTYKNWEAIVVNNYSEDNTKEVVDDFNEPRIKLIDFRNNGIIAASRNKAIIEANGEIVAFLDSDDLWYPDKLEVCVGKLVSEGQDAVCHGEKWIWVDGCSRDVQYGPASSSDYNSLLFDGNCISTSALICRREHVLSVGCFSEDKEIVTAEDYDLWLKLARSGVNFSFITTILGEYRIHPGGSSQAIRKNVRAIINVISRHANTLDAHKLIRLRKSKANVYLGASRGMQKQGMRANSVKYIFSAMLSYPFILRIYLQLVFVLLPRFAQDYVDKR